MSNRDIKYLKDDLQFALQEAHVTDNTLRVADRLLPFLLDRMTTAWAQGFAVASDGQFMPEPNECPWGDPVGR